LKCDENCKNSQRLSRITAEPYGTADSAFAKAMTLDWSVVIFCLLVIVINVNCDNRPYFKADDSDDDDKNWWLCWWCSLSWQPVSLYQWSVHLGV